MIADSSGPARSERLSRLERRGHPLVNVYLDLDPARFPTPTARGALLGDARRDGADRDADRIEALRHAEPTITRGVRALAIFSSVSLGLAATRGG